MKLTIMTRYAKIMMTACALFLAPGMALAHEGGQHMKMNEEDMQMMKLHTIMPMYAQAQARIKAALDKGDSATVGSETGKILGAIPDLKKSKPHKHLRQIKTMRKLAAAFEADVNATAVLAKKGDLAGARAAFAKAQEKCNECHAKFRD